MAVGLVGTVLHVAVWLMAVIFDIIIGAAINQDQSPGAFTYWLWGFVALLVGFVSLVGVALFHMFSAPENKIPEGGAPPFLMSPFIGGAQISLTLTILQMIASTGSPGNESEFWNYPNSTSVVTIAEQKDWRNAQRGLMVWSMLSKIYIVQFLKNNQEWAVRIAQFNPMACLVTFLTLWFVRVAGSRRGPQERGLRRQDVGKASHFHPPTTPALL